mgnify:CR=1 FL=1
MNDEPLAPIAVFAFKRPTDTRRLLQSLCANPEWIRSDVWVFCEGPRGPGDQAAVDATRAVVREQAWHPKMRVIEHESNQGCAKSIIDGIGRVLTEHETVIVLEDDLEVSPHFLAYMNEGLRRYATDERVMQLAGYMFDVDVLVTDDALFLPFVSSWGWATWRRAWSAYDHSLSAMSWLDTWPWRRFRFDLHGAFAYRNMLAQAERAEIDAWDIRWYLSVFRRDGLCLFPRKSLVKNYGFDNGTHATSSRLDVSLDRDFRVGLWPGAVRCKAAARTAMENFLRGHPLRARELLRGIAWA